MKGVCQSCGSIVEDVLKACPECGFDALSISAKEGNKIRFYQALALSTSIKSDVQLAEISAKIKNGGRYQFTETEISEAKRQTGFPWIAFLRFLLPIAVIIGLVIMFYTVVIKNL